MKKVLIANRGEIAVRIIRGCRDYGVQSVAVYADGDADSLFVKLADEAYALQGESPTDSYLNIEKLIDIAQKSGADAIHPGYGFLSERADAARAFIAAGLNWIGPQPEVIEKLGDKVQARLIARDVNAPLVAGTNGPVENVKDVSAFAAQHGFPIAVKAAFGGGGRGMKVIWSADEIDELFHSAVREATAAFGRGECYVEQFIDKPRHVEAQIVADKNGNTIVVGTRDCSLQRRNQKLIEEAPAPFLTNAQRQTIHTSSVAICKAAHYSGVGTVEFLLGSNGVISFLEVNTRLQVEHPVSEETTGFDLVIEQLRIADGLNLSIDKTPEPIGHAIEFRINAEDVARGFLPSPGPIKVFSAPSGPGIRIDSGVVSGSVVVAAFDSMMAKLIVHGKDRTQAIARARRALKEFCIEGVASVLPFHRAVIENTDFTDEFKIHTRWIETDFVASMPVSERALPVHNEMQRFHIEIDGKYTEIGLPPSFIAMLGTANMGALPKTTTHQDKNAVTAPVPGQIRIWNIKTGDSVHEGDTIGLMEAMKMETAIVAHISGKIEILADPASTHSAGDVIARIKT